MCDTAGMHNGGADVIDQLFFDQLLAIENGVKHLSHGKGRRGVLANQAKALLEFRRGGVFEPKQMIWLELRAQARGLNGRQAMVGIMQHVNLGPKLAAQASEQLRYEAQVVLGGPLVLRRSTLFGRLIGQPTATDAIGALQPWNSRLRADRLVAQV